jgi:hypothetical protein
MKTLDVALAREAKAIVALAFRNGPIEDVHAGKVCPVCSGSPDYSRITEDEMKAMMKTAVNAVYKLLWNRDHDSEAYRKSIEYGVRFTSRWEILNKARSLSLVGRLRAEIMQRASALVWPWFEASFLPSLSP